jgi:hypothetical protein
MTGNRPNETVSSAVSRAAVDLVSTTLPIQRDDPAGEAVSPGLATVTVVNRTVTPTSLTVTGDALPASVVSHRVAVSR